MASTDATNWPKKNAARRITFGLFDVNDDLVSGATGLDSEVSKDGAAFVDCTNEATEIGSTGVYYLDLTATEMNADTVAVNVKSTDANPHVEIMYPVDVNWDDIALTGEDGIRSVNGSGESLDSISGYVTNTANFAQSGSTSTTIKLAASAPSEDLTGLSVLIGVGTGAGQRKRMITAYDTSTKVATINPAWGVTPDATSYYLITDFGDVWRAEAASYASKTGTMGKYMYDIGANLTIIATYVISTGVKVGSFVAGSITSAALNASALASQTIASVTGAVGSVTGNVGGNVVGSVASVTGAVGSVTGNVGGNVVGSVASVTGAVGSVTSGVSLASGAITSASLSQEAADDVAIAVWNRWQEKGFNQVVHVAPTVVATLTTSMTGVDNDIYAVSMLPGTSGNSISLTINGSAGDQALSVSVSGTAVTVNAATTSGTITSKVSEVVDALNDKYTSRRLARWCVKSGDSGSGVVTTLSTTSFSGGTAGSGSDSNDGLSIDAPLATISAALTLAGNVQGTLIQLYPGCYSYGTQSTIPDFTEIRGAGPKSTSLRMSSIGAYYAPGFGTKLSKVYLDGRADYVTAVFTGQAMRREVWAEFEHVYIEANAYGVWASRATTTSPATQPQHWKFRHCDIRGAISAFSSQGNASAEHELEAWDCTFVADSWYYGNTILGNSYAGLSVFTKMRAIGCHWYGRTTSRQFIAGGLQVGDPTAINSPGYAWIQGGTVDAYNTDRQKAQRLENVSIASEAVFTLTGHGYVTGDYVEPEGLIGSAEIAALNGKPFKCVKIDNDTFKLTHPVTGAYQSTAGGTYTVGTGTCRTGIEWAIFADTAGSEIFLEGLALTPWSVKAINGAKIYSEGRDVIEKVSILQGGRRSINYADPTYGVDFPRSMGWSPDDPWLDIQDALNASYWGDTVYLNIGDSGKPFYLTAPLIVPPGVNVEGRGIDRTTIVCNFGTTEADAAFVCSGNNKIENLTIKEGTGTVTGILCTDPTTLVVDHCKILTTYDCVRHEASTADTLNVENSRLVSSSGKAVMLTGAAHTCFIGGIHPYTKGVVAVQVEDGSRCTVEGLAETSGSYVFVADGGYIFAAGCNFDIDKVSEANGGVVRTEENVAEVLLDRPNGVETGWSLRGWLRVIGALIGGRSSGVAAGSPVYRDLTNTKDRVTGTATNGDRTAVTYDQT